MKDLIRRVFNANLLKYLGIGYLSTVLNVVLSLLTIKFLEPISLGKLTIGRSIFQSFEFSHFGIRNGLDRHLPGDKNPNVKSLMFAVSYYSSLFFSLLFVLFWVVYQQDDFFIYSSFYLSGLFYTLITIYRIYYRSQDNKSSFINISIIINVIPVAAQIVGFYLYKLNGLVGAHILSYIFSYIFIKKYFQIEFKFKKKSIYPIFRKLFNSGYLLFLSALLSYLSTIGDRFFIANYWGLKEVGLFSVIMFVFNIFTIISVNYTELILSKIIGTKSIQYVLRQLLFITTLVFILVIIAYFLLPLLVNYFLPKYSSVLLEMKYIIFGAIPYAGLSILNFYLHAIDKRKILLIINLVCTSLYFTGLMFILTSHISILNLILLKLGFFTLIFFLTIIAAIVYSKKQLLSH